MNDPLPADAKRRRRIGLLALAATVAVGLAAFAAYWFSTGRYHATTEDAYVAGNLVQVTPQVPGTVVTILADDTDLVRAGQRVVELDRSDAQVAVDQAEALLAKTVRDVRGLYAAADQLRATIDVRRTEAQRAREDLARRESLAGSGAVSGEELEHARTSVAAAEAALAAAREAWSVNVAQTDGTDVASHPLVRDAAARVRAAFLAHSRAGIAAPVTGYVAKRTVQVGQRIQPGAVLMSIVPLDALWVDANFKEDELLRIRIGQPVRLEADMYGGTVEYRGRVEGLAAGTGSVFALLPAQNATGNWIKVVQRVPVRIALEPQQLQAHPLRMGLSMRVVVDTHDASGAQLAGTPRTAPRWQAAARDPALVDADRRIAEIVRTNAPAPARVARTAR